MTQWQYDVIVIGSGPGGEVGAIRAAQLGLKVAVVEKSPHLGGTCLNVGCIPTKALLQSALMFDKAKHLDELGIQVKDVAYDWTKVMGRKEKIVDTQRKGLQFLMRKNKIDVHRGYGRLLNANTVSVTDDQNKATNITAKNILLATGSRVRELPFAKSTGRAILTSDSVLFIDHVPESICVIGGGIVGMEFASLFSRFGSKVTVLEAAPQCIPSEDEEAVSELIKYMKKFDVQILNGVKVKAIEEKGNHALVSVEGQSDALKFDKVLVSIGREPVTNDIGLEKLGIKTDRGFVLVDKNYRTNVNNVFAIGDIIPTPALAHTASAEAIHAVEIMAAHKPPVIDYNTNPSAVYTYPEIASVGLTEAKLKEKKQEYKVAKFPFQPLAKAKIDMATEGFIKILYDPKFREILGVHIVGAKATELIAEFALGKVLETTVDEIAHTIHPHPTLSETIMEAAHVAMGGAIHL